MVTNFVSQINLQSKHEADVNATAGWLEYFKANADRNRPVPWHLGAELTDQERETLASSLPAWQLGETSDGSHLRTVVARFAQRTGDWLYTEVMDLFIREEQRHGQLLGQFLDLAGIPRLNKNWGDSLFRKLRGFLSTMEMWTTPVIMVETMALIYYQAVRRATGSGLLREICTQILRDEGPHLRFQQERLALLLRRRHPAALMLTSWMHRALFLGVVLLVWLGHRQMLRAGGYPWRKYWQKSWKLFCALPKSMLFKH